MPTFLPATPGLRCVVCRVPFDFAAGETAVVLRHVAYGYDFVHDGACLAAACERIFPEPGYDCTAFGRDPERCRLIEVTTAEGWSAVFPNTPEEWGAGPPVRFEPLRYWAVVEHADGSRCMEALVRDEMWLDEPGGAEFPEAARGGRALLGYVPPAERHNPVRLRRGRPSLRRAGSDQRPERSARCLAGFGASSADTDTCTLESAGVAGLQQTVLERVLDQVRAAAQAEFLHAARLVGLDRTDAQEQLFGDVLGGVTQSNQP